MTRDAAAFLILAVTFGSLAVARGADDRVALANAEIESLKRRVPAFKVIDLPVTGGTLSLHPNQSVTIDDLRGVQLDNDPPRLRNRTRPYPPGLADPFPPGEAPYIAKDIEPFRFRHFNCEFNYTGGFTYEMVDYASAHGFNIVVPSRRTGREIAHLPDATRWLRAAGFINWLKWLPDHGIDDLQYQMAKGMNLVDILLENRIFKRRPASTLIYERADQLMIDLEHPILPLEALREKPWYPTDAPPAAQRRFERDYVRGYGETFLASVRAARKEGWKQIGLYPWAPHTSMWHGLAKPHDTPQRRLEWEVYGRELMSEIDVLHPSVYCFYWKPQNVAFTLEMIDRNMAFLETHGVSKPLRPYYWTLLHGGGGKAWAWWAIMPIANEEARAMFAMGFFTGFDGFDCWNWSGNESPHRAHSLDAEWFAKARARWENENFNALDEMLDKELELRPDGAAPGTPPQTLRRYDVIHILSVDESADTVRFQKVRPEVGPRKHWGVTDQFPTFVISRNRLRSYLRVRSDPVAAMIEGMAMVKPIEYILRHGEVKIDVSAAEQFLKRLPIVRRVKLGKVHVVITYDPGVVYGGSPRQIELEDFDGRAGLTLRLPADDKTRIFVLQDH